VILAVTAEGTNAAVIAALTGVGGPFGILGAPHGRRATRYEWKKHLLKYSLFPIPYSLLPAPCSLLPLVS